MSLIRREQQQIDSSNMYVNELKKVRVIDPYFSVMHDQFYELIREVFKRLVHNGNLSRSEEFLNDVELFKFDMIRKYENPNIYASRPRSPLEKKKGIPHEDDAPKALLELKRKLDDDFSDLSY